MSCLTGRDRERDLCLLSTIYHMRYLKHRFFLYVLHQCDYSATIVINYEHRENAAARLELDRGAIAALHSHFFSALLSHSHIVRLRV